MSLARVATLLAMFSVVSISSRETAAQLGSLVVTMTSPASGSTVSGGITVSANVSIIGGLTVAGVQFTLDGVNLGAEDGTAPYSIPWNTKTAGNGSHALTAVARDLLGVRWTSQPVTVTVFNDTTAPIVSMTTPAPGSTVRGTAAVNANASDNVGVAGVQFRLDGANLGTEDTTAPYSISWTTTTATNGSHTLTAVARDAAGNVTTSAAVTVTVDNAFPTVTLTAPASGSTVAASITASAGASDNVGVVGVQFRLDGAALGAEDTAPPYSTPWNTATASNGSHSLTAVARDAAGNVTTSAAVTVTVDNAFPTVTITAPASGSTVAGSIAVSAGASDNVGVVGVQFRLDGAVLDAEDTAAPYSISWNTTTLGNGSHTLTAIARDAAGNRTTSAATTVTVSNDTTLPAVIITSPSSGATVGGTITVAASASDNVGVAGVQFLVDGAPLGAEDTTAPYSVTWNTTTASNSSHALTARARDAAGNVATSVAATVTIDNALPAVTIASPAGGATVSGSVTVTASASDNVGVAGVQFFLDAAPLGAEDTTAPYSVTWNTTTAANGSQHTLTARARDGAGNTATSSTVTATVSNGDTSPPTVAVTSPAAGATVSGSVTVTASASDNVGVAGVQFRLDGASLGAEDIAAPYSFSWDTASVANGSHTFTAVARDDAGNTATSVPVTVTVANTAQTLRIEETSAALSYVGGWDQGNTARAWSGGTAALGFVNGQRATLSFTGTSVSWVGFRAPFAGIANVYLDGPLVATVDAYATAETVQAVLFASSGLASGPHSITIEATGTKNAASVDDIVVVDAFDITGTFSDTTPPTVTITTPSTGTIVSGAVPVTAGAADNFGVAGVRFFADGTQVGVEDTVAPYSVSWDTTTVTDGSHALTAAARDGAGNTTTSATVTVTVSHAPPTPISTATRFEETDLSIVYTPGTAGPGQPPDWFHGSRSRSWTLGTASFNRSAGARATFPFTGTAVRWIGFRAPWAGIARVFVDGTFVSELDLYQTTEEPQATVFTATNLAAGGHTLAVESTGLKNANSADYAVVVDAFDVSPSSPPPPTGTRFEETASATSFTAGWTQGDTTKAWSGATAAVSVTPGARAVFTFAGTSVRWIGLSGPQTGVARVFLDGAFQATVDTYAPTEIQAVVFKVTGLAAARHRLEVEVTGQKNAAATNSSIAVDAFDIRPRFEDADPSITYSGAWTAQDTIRAYSGTSLQYGGGTAARSATAGARAQFAFTGTSVSWVGLRGPWLGMADVFVDGGLAARVDLYSPNDVVQATLFSTGGLPDGPHTLRIDVTGEKNPAATSAWVIVDAFDVALPAAAASVTRVQEGDPSITYTGTADWPLAGFTPLWSGENARWSTIAGTRATFTFTGTSVRWIGERGFATGIARISLDGALVAQVDTRTPFQEEYQATLFGATGLTPGSHTLTIDVIGRNNEPAGATVERVVVDAFDVY